MAPGEFPPCYIRLYAGEQARHEWVPQESFAFTQTVLRRKPRCGSIQFSCTCCIVCIVRLSLGACRLVKSVSTARLRGFDLGISIGDRREMRGVTIVSPVSDRYQFGSRELSHHKSTNAKFVPSVCSLHNSRVPAGRNAFESFRVVRSSKREGASPSRPVRNRVVFQVQEIATSVCLT